jgi:competence protein ComEA
MALTRLQRGVLITMLAGIVGASLVAVGSRTLRPTMPDVAIFRPAPDQPRWLLVYVAGAVAQPGLYWVPEGARVAQVLQLAGGARADADLGAVNLAAYLHDGDQVLVPTKPRPPEYQPLPQVDRGRVSVVGMEAPQRSPAVRGRRGVQAAPAVAPTFPLNVNTATPAELEALPGIGPALAQRIVEYRSAMGPLRSLADLEKVRGIGPKTAARLAPYVTF